MSDGSAHKGFIALTPGTSTDDLDGSGSDRPKLIINPQALAAIEDLEDGTRLRLRLVDGTTYTLGPMNRMRARSVQRDLLVGVGRPVHVDIPPQTPVVLEREGR